MIVSPREEYDIPNDLGLRTWIPGGCEERHWQKWHCGAPLCVPQNARSVCGTLLHWSMEGGCPMLKEIHSYPRSLAAR